MLNKAIGSLHTVPVPSAAVLGESLKLLATFGDKKAISTLLEEVRDVQAHNEQVFRDAQALIGELSVQRQALDVSQREFSTKVAHQEAAIQRDRNVLTLQESKLDGSISKFDQEKEAYTNDAELLAVKLGNHERLLNRRESECKASEDELSRRVVVLDRQETELGIRAQQLQEKENKLRALLGS